MNPRIQKLRTLLQKKKLDAIFISSLPNITYLTNFSGFSTEDRDAYLLITQNEQYIFTHGIYKETVELHIKDFKLIAIQRENPINIAIKKIVDEQQIRKLGFESFDLTVDEYDKLVKQIAKKILVPHDLISTIRIIKSSEEIVAIQKACQLGDQAFLYICKQIRAGITEQELATELTFFVKRHGADMSFPSIVAFGPN
ncbi:MAG TPA: aminopeptidase P family N-terminal domain-containing protein, partial [Candidatus Sulfotelmatobacter sp.]|nr:aminopeptidase P family N-terminal domain-containing protein [Candidatus Sulfotelmatobacter sp.]